MEKLLSILNSFNLGDRITQGLNFIDTKNEFNGEKFVIHNISEF